MQRTSAPVPICAGGDKLRNPFQELLVTFGVVKNIYSEGFQEVTPYASCTIIESVFAYWDTTQDDSFCYWNQLVRGQICGCPDNSEVKALVWTQRCSGILSPLISGSLLISMSIITKREVVTIQSNRPEYLLLRLAELYYLHHWHFVRSEGARLAWINRKRGYMWLSNLAIPIWPRVHLL